MQVSTGTVLSSALLRGGIHAMNGNGTLSSMKKSDYSDLLSASFEEIDSAIDARPTGFEMDETGGSKTRCRTPRILSLISRNYRKHARNGNGSM